MIDLLPARPSRRSSIIDIPNLVVADTRGVELALSRRVSELLPKDICQDAYP